MNSLIFKYPLDYSGTSQQNSLSLDIKLSTGHPNRAAALPHGPMFANTIRVVNSSSPATPLVRGKDYQLIITNQDLITRCKGKEIVHAIVVFNDNVSNNITLSGNVVGGPYGTNLSAIEQIVDAINADTRKISWASLKDVPDEYTAAPAYYDVGDIYGFEYIVMALGQIESAIRLKDNAEMVRLQEMITQMRSELSAMFQSHIDAKGNVHSLTRTQLGVYSTGEVDNIFQEAVNRFNTLVGEIGKLENADIVLSNRIDGVITTTSNYITQIVESNLEHVKNTVEIGRVAQGLAEANKRINDANLAISKNNQLILSVQEALNKHIQDNVAEIEQVYEDMQELGGSKVNKDLVNFTNSEIWKELINKIPYVDTAGHTVLGTSYSMRMPNTNNSASWKATAYNNGIYFSAWVSAVDFDVRSDKRTKENFSRVSAEEAYTFLRGCNGWHYNIIGNDEKTIGLIAQDVRKSLPSATRTIEDPKSNKKTLHIKPMAIIATIVVIIKDIHRRLRVAEKRTDKIAKLERRLKRLEREVYSKE